MTEANQHTPVLIDAIMQFMDHKGVVFDGTAGGGGYIERYLAAGHEVYASDSDPRAIELLNTKFSEDLNNGQLHLQQGNFLEQIQKYSADFFDYIVLDLGYSSNQLEFSKRGFSYEKEAELLDLRYDPNAGLPFHKLLKKVKNSQKFAHILYAYSGEVLCKIIVPDLLQYVRSLPNEEEITVGHVKTFIVGKIAGKRRKQTKAILSRFWQSFRIYTNHEFEQLDGFLAQSLSRLKNGGLLLIVDFHSLEDKMITKFMRTVSKPLVLDDYGNTQEFYKLLTRKGIQPSESEIENNPRSRSATLRVLEKL